MDNSTPNLQTLMATRGVEVIGDVQTDIAYTAVADDGNGLAQVEAEDHGLKKHQSIYFPDGVYQGTQRITKIIDKDNFVIDFAFQETETGNMKLTVVQDGEGFIVNDAVALVIEEFEPEDELFNGSLFLEKTFVAGEVVHIPFKKLRISAGDVTVVRGVIKTDLPWRDTRFFPGESIPTVDTITVENADPDKIVITFDSPYNLDEARVPSADRFTLTGVTGDPTITAVVVDDTTKKVTLTLSGDVDNLDTPTLSYDGTYSGSNANVIQNINGLKALSFEDIEIDNNVV